ncbi:hypothetical protein BRADI_5g23307v3 [Brachypodium distachyon]|nr:hypothetical protein BRADI_5g23307v3 [Brachypodium distachyon]
MTSAGSASAANLAELTESFLRDAVLPNWDASVRALQTCSGNASALLSRYAEELGVVSRCVESLASKACADPTLFGSPMLAYYTAKEDSESASGSAAVMWNGIATAGKPRAPGAGWWYKQATSLHFPFYKRLISEMKSKGMSPHSVGGSLMHYATRHISGLNTRKLLGAAASSEPETTTTVVTDVDGERALLEEIVALMPPERGAATARFLLAALRTAAVLHAGEKCRSALETMAGAQLEEAALEELLIPNVGYASETLYDVDSVQRMLERFFVMAAEYEGELSPEIVMADGGDGGREVSGGELAAACGAVAKLVDGYLAEVGSDAGLKLSKFQTVAALVPDHARPLDDGLYRAIDIYLKAHPGLTNTEREQVCRLMNCQKLSLEACTHAAQNERLPLRVVVQVLFFEQLRLRTTVAGWFFVSDNAVAAADPQRPGSSNSSSRPRKSFAGGLGDIESAAGSEEEDDDEAEIEDHDCRSSSEQASVEEIRQRVVELEEECSSMRHEIHRLGKPKGALGRLFRKLGLANAGGGKSSSSRQLLKSSSEGKRSRFLDLGC